jgi:hypothetical protein
MALAGPDGPASTLGRPEVRVRGPESPIPVSGNDGSSFRVQTLSGGPSQGVGERPGEPKPGVR